MVIKKSEIKMPRALLKYDAEYRIGYVKLSTEKVSVTTELRPFIGLSDLHADYDFLGNLVGFEFITSKHTASK